jgi:hypothetical protein
MSVFLDKKFEELDWISQAMEPIDSELNEYLSVLPDELDITFDLIVDMCKDHYSFNLSLIHIVPHLLRLHYGNKYKSTTWKQKMMLEKCFQFKSEGDSLIIDFENKSISGGKIKLVKIRSTMDEKDLEEYLGADGVMAIRGNYSYNQDCCSRMNEVMELLGSCENGLKSKSSRIKAHVISSRLKDIFKKNEWKIKDTTLANKIGYWIDDYIANNNLASLSNFCRLKVMTHKGQPIYSMEEVV